MYIKYQDFTIYCHLHRYGIENMNSVTVVRDEDGAPAQESEDINNTEEKEEGTTMSLRRSNRNTNAIRLRGSAQTFYRRLQILFFNPSSNIEYQSIGGSRMELERVHNDPPIYIVDDFLTQTELAYFDEKVESCKFERSFVDNMKEMDGEGPKVKRQKRTILDSLHRTSTFFAFKKVEYDCLSSHA